MQVLDLDDDEDVPLSPYFCAPEVLWGAQTSVQSDVYSLAATIWYILVGHSPFIIPGADNRPNLAFRVRVRDTPVPATGRPDVPQSLDRLLQLAMAKDPARRPRSALDFGRALQQIEQELRLPRTELQVVSAEEEPSEVRDSAGDATQVRARAAAPAPAPAKSGHSRWAPARAPAPETKPRAPQLADATVRRHTAEPVARGRSPRRAVESTATVLRPKIAGPEPETRSDRPVRRWMVIAAAGVVIATAAAILIVLQFGRSTGTDAKPRGATSTELPSPQPDALPPGKPAVTGHRLNPSAVTFTWSYSAQLGSDTFRWQTPDGSQSGVVQQPEVTLTVPAGTAVCVQVKVIRADGSNAAPEWSPEGCVNT